MSRKKQTKTEDTPAVTLEGHAVLEALRSNLTLLGELAAHYEVSIQPERPAEMPTIGCPQDVFNLLGAGNVGPGPGATESPAAQHPQQRDGPADRLPGQRQFVHRPPRRGVPGRPSSTRPPASLFSHNHPSGDPTPSPEDVKITRELVEGGKLLGIDLMDHIVIAGDRYVSLKERKLMDT